MKTLELKIEIGFCSVDELKEADRELVEAARQATANSYSPYSHFSVGAALRLSDGEIIIGANRFAPMIISPSDNLRAAPTLK